MSNVGSPYSNGGAEIARVKDRLWDEDQRQRAWLDEAAHREQGEIGAKKPRPAYSPRRDIPAGTRFGRWSVLGEAPPQRRPGGDSHRCLFVRCDCGTKKVVLASNLTTGISKSCRRCSCIERERRRRGRG